MSTDVTLQLQGLCRAVLLGGTLGVVYDLMRVVRRRCPHPVLGGVLDFLFWLGATAALFCFSHETWEGQVRLYGALFCLLGGCAYFWGVSPLVMTLGMGITAALERILALLTAPVRALGRLFKSFGKILKNSFLSKENGV